MRGIVQAATGSGKTQLALEAIRQSDSQRVVIVVPSIPLQRQWLQILRSRMSLSPRVLGTMGGPKETFTVQHKYVVAVINSAREGISHLIKYWHEQNESVLLIVDECHWAGSLTSEGLFKERPDLTLGLSATPERSDSGFDDILVPNLGDIIFQYPLQRAIEDGVLSEITSYHLFFRLSREERHEEDRRAEEIRSARAELSREFPDLGSGPGWIDRLVRLAQSERKAAQLLGLLGRQKQALTSSRERLACLNQLIQSGHLKGRRTMIFHDTIERAERVSALLHRQGVTHAVEHSKRPAESRDAALRKFAMGTVNMLLTVKALDEGVDIPDADTAVFFSASLSPRQRTQRIGRVARDCATNAQVISLLAEESSEQWELAVIDAELLGGQRVERLRLPEA
jgi:superfamily II DNA or RNA helicase